MNNEPGHRWLSQGAEVLVQEITDQPDALHCDVLIVGSGYGGAVAAARLAGARPRAGGETIRLIVLERGNEYLPGEFPSTFGELPGHVRFSAQDGQAPRGRPTGLFDIRLGEDVSVLLGNGLGGGSLINAAVMERPSADAFTAKGWPATLTESALEPFYCQAQRMLQPEQMPGEPAKLASLMAAAQPMSATMARKAYVAVAFADGHSAAGVPLAKCLECGDCVSGCNHRAKKSLDVNYLALARAKHARFFCGATVHVIRELGNERGYEVDFYLTDPHKAPSDTEPYRLRARRVILAAGSLGSTEILLRSRASGLRLPQQGLLGRRFSTNGDMIAAAYGQTALAHGGTPEGVPPAERKVGPTITGLVRTPSPDESMRPLVFEEFGIPGPIHRLLGEVVTTVAMLNTRFEPDAGVHRPGEGGEDPLAVSAERIDHTLVYGIMGDDGAAGELVHRPGADRCDGQIAVEWANVGELKVFEHQLARLRAAHEDPGPCGGRVLPNPLWRPLPALGIDFVDAMRRGVFTVHPLGGCVMGHDATTGVVDDAGRVFAAGNPPTDTLPGLAVLDGSIVPVSLGINPALTIAALAERAVPVLAGDWELTLDATQPTITTPRPVRADRTQPRAPASTRFTLHERMRGRLRLDDALYDCSALIDFDAAEVARLRRLPRVIAFSRVALEFNGSARDTPSFQARCTGSADVLVRDASSRTVRQLRALRPAWRRLSPYAGACGQPKAWRRRFLALCSHLGTVRLIRYQLTVTETGDEQRLPVGTQLCLTKRLEFVDGGNPWRQLSEGVFERVDACRVELGSLATDLSYFAEQMVPLLRIAQQHDAPNALGDLAELVLWIARVVLDVHLLSFLPALDDIARNDKARLPGPVNGIAPAAVPLADGKSPGSPRRLLSRYVPAKATPGARPVLLIHGYGASGSTFTHPAIGSADGRGSLAAALLAAGRDVWVLDMRTSIGLPENRTQAWMFDETALSDIPEAIAQVLTLSDQGPEGQLDVVAHCIGAAMFSVAVLAAPGDLHKRIGCAVLSQVAPLVAGSPMNRFRAYVASYLEQYLGVQSLDVRGPDDDVLKLLVDGVLNTFPYPDDDGEAARLHERPGFAALRHRADAIFGQTMRLANIGHEMLGSLDAIYGFVSTRGLAQVGHYVSQQVLTDALGQNRHVAFETLGRRFGFPLLIVHGRHNAVFDWRGSYRAYTLLKQVFEGQTLSATPPEIDPDDDLLLGADTPRRLLVLGRYGHQDTLIGRRVHRDVFPYVVRFLDEFARLPVRVEPQPPTLVIRLPWTGPTLGAVQRVSDGELRCRLALRAPRGHASTLAVVFVPAVRTANGWDFNGQQAMAIFATSDELITDAIEVALNVRALPDFQGFAVLNVHTQLPAPIERGTVLRPKADKTGLFINPEAEPAPEVLALALAFLSADAARADEAVVRLDAAWIQAAQLPADPPQRALCLALASCQYPAGLFDTLPAQASYTRLAARLDTAPTGKRPQLLLLMGDQVYVDETAGLFTQPGGSAIDRAYEMNHRLPAYRRVTRSLPTYPMLDDHEVHDNWEPPVPSSEALTAYVQRQHKLVNDVRTGPFAHALRPGGLPLLVLDTRTARDARVLRAPAQPALLQDAQIVAAAPIAALQALTTQPATAADVPKFIVSPVAVFPLQRAAAFGHPAERIALDDWGGFPRSQLDLLAAVRDLPLRNVILLSGDRHLSSVSSLWLKRADGTEVEVISIVSSGLYAPWPFANAQPEEYWLDGPLRTTDGAIEGRMHTPLVGRSDGYAVVSVTQGADGVWVLDVVLDQADGERHASKPLDGRPDTPWRVWQT